MSIHVLLVLITLLSAYGVAGQCSDETESINSVCVQNKEICQKVDSFVNPILETGADPWVIRHDGKYYYSGSDGNQKIFIREFDKITEMRKSENHIVYDFSGSENSKYAVWGPHLNFIQGHWYIYYCGETANDPSFKTQRMWVLKSSTGSPYGPYEDMGEVLDSRNKDWAIDGSVLVRSNGDLYFVWSGIPDLSNLHQCSYIARMVSPCKVDRSTISMISYPDRPWETSVRPIQEGQRPLYVDRNGKTILMFSGNASWSDEYCLGSLTNESGDFLDPKAWKKSDRPLFHKTDKVFGPGGASYVKSPDGTEDWIIYHSAREKGSGWTRIINAQPFRWNPDGSPDFGEPVPGGERIPVPSGEE